MKNSENLGIPSDGMIYHRLKENQNILVEYCKTINVLKEYVNGSSLTNNKKNIYVKFINYGDTQLVFVLSADDEKHTVLVGQPATEMGVVKIEHDNLLQLSNTHPDKVVAPIDYYKNDSRELYITPYINQARCIASDHDEYGIYVPEPVYHFEKFSDNERFLINSAMIGLLVTFYDHKNNMGIADCRIGGGDFILEKCDGEIKNINDALGKLKLIAARKLINIEFGDYLNLLRREFVQCTYYDDESNRDKEILVNVKNRIPMTLDEIENGISLGRSLTDCTEIEF